MAFFRRADEVIIGDIKFFPELLEEGDDFVDVFNRFYAFCFGCTLDFLAVFIRAGQEKTSSPRRRWNRASESAMVVQYVCPM